jgi:hypothetical protein
VKELQMNEWQERRVKTEVRDIRREAKREAYQEIANELHEKAYLKCESVFDAARIVRSLIPDTTPESEGKEDGNDSVCEWREQFIGNGKAEYTNSHGTAGRKRVEIVKMSMVRSWNNCPYCGRPIRIKGDER